MGAVQQMLAGGGGRLKVTVTIAANTQNYVLNTAKVAGYQAGNTDVTLVINGGVYVGATSTGAIALDVDTSWNVNDKVFITNNGAIVGCGGAGGSAAATNGGAGGPAFRVQRPTSVTNNGTIGGGGGGGGAGGGRLSDFAAYALCIIDYVGGGGGGGGAGYSGGAAGGAGYFSLPSGGPILQNMTGGGAGGVGGGGGGGVKGIANSFNCPSAGQSGGDGGAGGFFGAAGANGGPSGWFGYFCYVPGIWYNETAGAGGGACTTSGSNAQITWLANGTRYGSIL